MSNQDNTTTDENKGEQMPVMTQDEMKKFVSTLSNTEAIQGDYVFNGFIYLFETLAQTIKTDPVAAQNILFHLQIHIFNNLMWESFWAFDAHRKRAHLIFRKTEPYNEFEETEQISDLPESSPENLAAALSGILKNPNLPEKIHNALADVLDVPGSDPHTPETILWNFGRTEVTR